MAKLNKPLHITIFAIFLLVILNTILSFLTGASFEFWFSQLFFLPSFLLVFTLTSLTTLLSWAIANKAQNAGRSWVAFFWLSALLSPLIMGIIAVTLKPLTASDTVPSATRPELHGNLESKLVELQNLKDKGILSEDEFTEAKKKALDL